MSEFMEDKFKMVCEDKHLNSMFMVDVEDAVYSAFKEVGYTPSKTIDKAIDKAWSSSHRDDKLSDFVLKVWRFDS